MRLKRTQIVGCLLAIALAATVTSLCGCAAVGFGVGAAIDSRVKDKSRCVVAHVRPGTSLTLHLRDGSQLRGRFRALIEPDSASYSVRYREWGNAASASGLLPQPDDRVTLSGRLPELTGAFRGFSPAGIRMQPVGAAATHSVLFRDFDLLSTSEGHSHASEQLEGMVRAGIVPTGTAVALQLDVTSSSLTTFDQNGPIQTVMWDDVVHVDGPAPVTGKIIGTFLGLTWDILASAYFWASPGMTLATFR